MLDEPQELFDFSNRDSHFPQDFAFDHGAGYLAQDCYMTTIFPPQTLQEDFTSQDYSLNEVYENENSPLGSDNMHEYEDEQHHPDGRHQSWLPVNSSFYDHSFIATAPHAPEPMQKTSSNCSTEQTLATVSSHTSKDSG